MPKEIIGCPDLRKDPLQDGTEEPDEQQEENPEEQLPGDPVLNAVKNADAPDHAEDNRHIQEGVPKKSKASSVGEGQRMLAR
jgi:hypothetical protein